jgi:hypothetical protein
MREKVQENLSWRGAACEAGSDRRQPETGGQPFVIQLPERALHNSIEPISASLFKPNVLRQDRCGSNVAAQSMADDIRVT